MIHTKTGDKEMTKRIITVGSIACVVTIIVFLMFAITKVRPNLATAPILRPWFRTCKTAKTLSSQHKQK